VADVAVFDPAAVWRVLPEAIRSRGKNTPLLGMDVTGATMLTIMGGVVRYRA
jgi:dihydroorotase